MELQIVLKVVTFITLQSCLLNLVSSIPVKFNQSSAAEQRFGALAKPVNNSTLENSLNKLNVFPRTTETKHSHAGVNNHGIFLRLLRSSMHPCVMKKVRKYNKCLGEFFGHIHCHKEHVGCLPFNAPPKCKKNYEMRYGESGRACWVVASCECA